MQNQQTHTPLSENQPLVTFIITYYNLPMQMLCECIDSIMALSLRSFEREIIIVDDGSDVSPMNGLMQYADDIVYVRQKNGGVSTARNTALKMARGHYIQIMDGDDYLLQAAYEHCLDIIRYKPDIDVLLFDFSKSSQEKATSYSDGMSMSGSEYMRNYNLRGAAWCCLFRQSIRGSLQFTPGVQYGEDEEFTPQLLLRAETVMTTNAQAYFYRKRNTSAVHQNSEEKREKRLNDTIGVILHLNELTDRLPVDDRLAIQRRVAQLTMDYIYNTIVLTHSRQVLDERLAELHSHGLFPLPDRDYSKKYQWFRRMTNTSFGRTILLNTLPLLKRER